ncbi:MAG: S-layer homology domain-containing protein [Clostridia bacterium]|nr:S-layer homology domain-containing protein [Clostridia bacterium]
MRRRFLSLALALALTAGLATAASAAAYSDVPTGAWYEEAVTVVTDAALMNGTSETTFSPDRAVTRGMAAAVLWRLSGSPQAYGHGAFPDVSTDSYYFSAVDWCAENSVITGYDNGNFGGNDTLTREQLAVLLYRFAVLNKSETGSGSLDNYPDAAKVSTWARIGMAHAVGLGLITGRDDGKLDPKGSATRAQLSVILQRLMTPAQG